MTHQVVDPKVLLNIVWREVEGGADGAGTVDEDVKGESKALKPASMTEQGTHLDI